MSEENRGMSFWKNAWRVRALALACIILFVGIGSQVLVNAFASSATTNMAVLSVTATAQEMRMSDGRWAYAGACAVSQKQFPLGTIIALYNQDGTFNRQCTAEDSSSRIAYGHIDLAMPGNATDAKKWGVRYLLAHIERWGWGKSGPPVIKPVSGLVPVRLKTPLQIFHPGLEQAQP
jgi:3D (Asp-Asp-Asp) domain-containing protein